MIMGYIMFLIILVIDFFLYAIITAYFDGTLERLENKLYEKITSKPTTK
jgi:hypothetical protein